jgi:hypothetical protein
MESIPAQFRGTVSLPLVGTGPTPTEEEIRESLRRFINSWQDLIGANPTQLSLVERSDESPAIKVARYEQRPFRYPLRGKFGELVIRFTADRKLVDLSSTCLPNADRLQSQLANLSPQLDRQDAMTHLQGRPITVTTSSGTQQNFTIGPNEALEVRELVVYAIPSNDQDNTVEVHLAWEIGLPNGPIKTLYLDAISDQVIAGA